MAITQTLCNGFKADVGGLGAAFVMGAVVVKTTSVNVQEEEEVLALLLAA